MFKKTLLICLLFLSGRQVIYAQGNVRAFKNRVTIYEHAYYEGVSKNLSAGKYSMDALGIGNDQLSSIKIPKNFKVTLYEHADFEGESITLTEDTEFVGEEFNDLTSSIVIEESKPNAPNNNPVVTNPTNEEMPSFKGCATGKENVPAENEAFEKKVLEIVNIERAKIGKPALVWNKNLARAARYHAADMATEDYFAHDSHDVTNGVKTKVCGTFERVGKFGAGYAENIAWGSNTPEGAMTQWINSPGHYKNIMSDNTSLGVGFYKNYWVQVFGPKE